MVATLEAFHVLGHHIDTGFWPLFAFFGIAATGTGIGGCR